MRISQKKTQNLIQYIIQLKQLLNENELSIQEIKTQLAHIKNTKQHIYQIKDKVKEITKLNTNIEREINNPTERSKQIIKTLTEVKKTLQNILALENDLNAKKTTAKKYTTQLKQIQQTQPDLFQAAQQTKHDSYIASAGELIAQAEHDQPIKQPEKKLSFSQRIHQAILRPKPQ